jgi:hypothetical protein
LNQRLFNFFVFRITKSWLKRSEGFAATGYYEKDNKVVQINFNGELLGLLFHRYRGKMQKNINAEKKVAGIT